MSNESSKPNPLPIFFILHDVYKIADIIVSDEKPQHPADAAQDLRVVNEVYLDYLEQIKSQLILRVEQLGEELMQLPDSPAVQARRAELQAHTVVMGRIVFRIQALAESTDVLVTQGVWHMDKLFGMVIQELCSYLESIRRDQATFGGVMAALDPIVGDLIQTTQRIQNALPDGSDDQGNPITAQQNARATIKSKLQTAGYAASAGF
jgi:hypothetical protein